MHTRHLSSVILVYIFCKICSVCCWLGRRELFFFNNLLLRSCDFFPRKLGCDAFPGTTICKVTASFHNFIFFTYFSIYYFNFICFPFWSTCQRCQVLMEPTFPKVIYQSLNLTLIFSAANISVIYVIQKIIVEISSI